MFLFTWIEQLLLQIIECQNNYNMLALNYSKLITIILAMALSARAITMRSFPQYIQTGSISFNGFNGNTIKAQTLTITFVLPKNRSDYKFAYSLQNLYLHVENKQMSIRVARANPITSTQLGVLIETQVGRTLNYIVVRYLTFVPPPTLFLQTVFFHKDYDTTVFLKKNIRFQYLYENPPINVSHTKTSLFLMGFRLRTTTSIANYFQLYCKQSYFSNNTLAVMISTNSDDPIFLGHLSLMVILINQTFILNNSTGTFEVYSQLNNYDKGRFISKINSNTVFDNFTTFFGIRALKNWNFNYGLYFRTNVINQTFIQFQTNPTQYKQNQFAIDIINFVFPPQCNPTMPYILFLNNTCYATCPTSYFGNVNTSTCDNCSSNCLTCNQTASNCLTCPADRYYNNSNNCSLCPDTCQQCTSDTACTQCINGSYIVRNGSCIVDCSPIPNCDICEIIGTTPICRNCSITYQLSGNSCVSICGDGFFAAGEECDDNNTESGDGCSLSCKLESQYFTCNNTVGATTVCSLKHIALQYSYTNKVTTSNAFIIFLTVKPNIPAISRLSWVSGISFSNPTIAPVSHAYDSSSGILAITVSYSSDIGSSPIDFSVNFQNMNSNYVSAMPSVTISQTLVTENNLSLQYYSSSVYSLTTFCSYLSIFLSLMAIVMLLVGFLGGKLIVLQHIAVLQVAYLCLQTVQDASPTFEALRQLRFGAGNSMFSQKDYSANMSRELKGSYYSFNILQSYNIAFGIVLLPIIVSIIMKLLSSTICKQSKLLPRVWPVILGDMTFYGLIFTAYFIFSQLCFSVLSISSGVTMVYMGLSISFFQALLIVIFCHFLNKYPIHFGDFKKKFQKYNICSYFYCFIVLQRFLTASIIILFRKTSYGLIVATIPIIAQLLFVAIRKPYVCGDDRRPVLNIIFTLLIMSSVLINNILPTLNALQIYVPVAILIMLTATLAYNSYYLIMEFNEIYCTKEQADEINGESKDNNDSAVIIDKIFKFQQPQNIEQKNRVQFEIFKQKMMSETDDISIIFNSKTHNLKSKEEESLQKQMLNYEWEHYPIVSSNIRILQQMKQKVKNKRMHSPQIIQQQNSP